ncbi:ester cyclase [Streptomyces sp. E11-3]|uniref:ester cyclase n=1 Tax=Streptomyces sp. E11-3 TaxID=3110112 RepID=UPI00397EA432
MTFVQVIDCQTSRIDELNQLLDSWAEATKGKRTATHTIMGQDRSDSSHVMEIVEFPSYEEAMKNSHLPETDRIFQEMVALCDVAPTFTDLDVVRDEQLNKDTVQRFFEEVVNSGNVDAVDALCTPDYADYRENVPALSTHDLEQTKRAYRDRIEAFGPQIAVESMVAEGDLVAVRFSFKARHVRDFQGIEATHRDVAGTGHCTFRCEGGKLAECWTNEDELGLLQQLGVLEG